MDGLAAVGIWIVVIFGGVFLWWNWSLKRKREAKDYEKGLLMTNLLIHLPPATDDVNVGTRDERDVTVEIISQAQSMYAIIASTVKKGWKTRLFGQDHITFEIVASDGLIRYFTAIPAGMVEVVRQAVSAAYPTARLEETGDENIFSEKGGFSGVAGGELKLKKEKYYPIATYEDTKRDASLALLNAMAGVHKGEAVAVQILLRPAGDSWKSAGREAVKKIKNGEQKSSSAVSLGNVGNFVGDLAEILWKPMEAREKQEKKEERVLTNAQQEEMRAIENKAAFHGFETCIRVIASSESRPRSEAILSGVVASFAQFDAVNYNGFKYEQSRDVKQLAVDFAFKIFPVAEKENVLNSVEMASIFHLPSQNVIPTSKVERQLIKQVDGPAAELTEGLLLGVNEYRGVKKQIRLADDDRRRHIYVIGSTGMGKSVLLGNMAYQDMMDGKGFAFLDPHGDVVESLLSKVPPERVDDVIYFDPGNMEFPMGMNMFEYETSDQKDFIVQEGINMLYSLYDPTHQGFFGPRGEHMFRNAALLLMSDPNGATFVDIPRVFIDPSFVAEKLKYVTDRNVYDYWTKEFPASQKSNDAGEVTTWFVSKWGPFLSNMMMRNILGQVKSGFNIREVMDGRKILLVNLSKGKMGELNSKLLGMILVMKFQTAAMARVNIPEDERVDFSLYVDEFQNFSTESFESILSEARKFRLSLVIANQFMTQLTEKIREGILGNVGTLISGRLGITDAQMMEKAFAPKFVADDLHKLPNYHAITTVLVHGMPSDPFTMSLIPPMGDENPAVLEALREYTAKKYGKARAEAEAEIELRMKPTDNSEKNSDNNMTVAEQGDLVSGEAVSQAEGGELGGDMVDVGEMAEEAKNGLNGAKNSSEGENYLDKWLESRKNKKQEEKLETSKQESMEDGFELKIH